MKTFYLVLFLFLNVVFLANSAIRTPTPGATATNTPVLTTPGVTPTPSSSILPPYYDKEILPPGVNRFPDDDGILMNENFENNSYIWENRGYNGYWDIVSDANGNKAFTQMNIVSDLNYAVNGSLSWDMYLYQVKARSLTDPSNSGRFDDVLYFFFHYLDEQNYYAFRIDASGNVTVIKMKGGALTQTPTIGTVFIPGEAFQISKAYMYYVVAWEDAYELWIDGLYICDWQEPDPMPRGKIGVGTWACAADFDDILVADLNEKLLQIPAYRAIVHGRYNKVGAPGQFSMDKWIPTDPLFVLGNGTKDIPSNALTVYKNGNAEINGNLAVAGGLFCGGKEALTDVDPQIDANGQLTLTLSNGKVKTAGDVGNVDKIVLQPNGDLIVYDIKGTTSNIGNVGAVKDVKADDSGNLIVYYIDGTSKTIGNIKKGVKSADIDGNGKLKITLLDNSVISATGDAGDIEDITVDANSNLNVKKIDGTVSSFNLKLITGATVDTSGDLIISLTNGEIYNAGYVIGQKGADGVGIHSVTIDLDGNLIITLTNGNSFNLGNITGPQGIQGKQGIPGAQGIQGPKGDQGTPGEQGIQGAQGPVGPQGLPGEPFGIKAAALTGLLSLDSSGNSKVAFSSGYVYGQILNVSCMVDLQDGTSSATNPKRKAIPLSNSQYYASEKENAVILTGLPTSYNGQPYRIVVYYQNQVIIDTLAKK